jgi:hypothetical protein
MRRFSLLAAVAICGIFSAPAFSQEMHPAARSTPAFDQFKALVGKWEGATPTGGKLLVTYELISNGSVLMERLHPANEPEMVTMYSLDGDRILATHYCSMGNQPTMQTVASPAPSGKYDFTFLHLSGAKSPDEAHMAKLTISIPDKDHLVQTWTFEDHGKSTSENLAYIRKS